MSMCHHELFNGDLYLVVAKNGYIETPEDKWRPYITGNIIVHEIACKHEEVMDPANANEIGRLLAVELADRP
jgi:thioesterase domain-containing protein